jgi:chromosome segregation ATPase
MRVKTNHLEDFIKDLKKKLEKVEKDGEEWSRLLDQNDAIIAELRADVEKRDNEIRRLKSTKTKTGPTTEQIQQLKKELEEAQAKQDKLSDEKRSVEKEMRQQRTKHMNENTKLNRQLEDIDKENRSLKNQLEELRAKRDDSRTRNELENVLNELDKQRRVNAEMQEQLENDHRRFEEIRDFESRLKEKQNLISSQTKEIAELKSTILKLELEEQEQENTLNRMRSDAEALAGELVDLESLILEKKNLLVIRPPLSPTSSVTALSPSPRGKESGMRKNLRITKTAKTNLKILLDVCLEKMREVPHLKDKLQREQNEADMLRSSNSDLEQALKNANRRSRDHLENSMIAQEETITTLNDEVSELRRIVTNNESTINSLTEDAQQLDLEVKQLTNENMRLKNAEELSRSPSNELRNIKRLLREEKEQRAQLQLELDDAQASLDSSVNLATNLRDKTERQAAEIRKLNQDLDSLKREYNIAQDRSDSLLNELQSEMNKRGKSKSIEDDRASLLHDNEILNSQIAALKQRLQEQKANIDSLNEYKELYEANEAALSIMRDDVEKSSREAKRLATENHRLILTNTNLSDELEEIRRTNEAYVNKLRESESNKRQNALNDLTKQVNELRESNEVLHHSRRSMEEQNLSMERELGVTSKLLKEEKERNNALERVIEELHSNTRSLEEQLVSLGREVNNQKRFVREEKERTDVARSEMMEQQKLLENNETMIRMFRDDVTNLEKDVKNLRRENHQLKLNEDSLRQELQTIDQEYNQLRAERDQINEKFSITTDEANSNRSLLLKKLEDRQKQFDTASQDVSRLKMENSKLEREIEALEMQLEQNAAAASNLQSQNLQLRKEMDELRRNQYNQDERQNHLDELDRRADRIANLNRIIDAASNDVSKIYEEYARSFGSKENAVDHLPLLQTSKQSLVEGADDDSRKSRSTIHQRLRALQQSTANAERAIMQHLDTVDQCNVTIDSLRNENTRLSKEKSAFSGEFEQLSANLARAREQLQDLEYTLRELQQENQIQREDIASLKNAQNKYRREAETAADAAARERDNHEDELRRLSSAIHSIMSQLQQFKSTALDKLVRQALRIKQLETSAQKLYRVLKDHINSLAPEHDKQKLTLQWAAIGIDEWKEKIVRDLKKQIQEYMNLNRDLDSELLQSRENVSHLHEHNNSLRQECREKDQLIARQKADSHKLADENRQLISQLDVLEGAAEANVKESERMNRIIAKLTETQKSLEATIQQQLVENTALTDKISDLQREILNAQERGSSNTGELREEKRRNHVLQKDLSKLREENELIRSDLENMQNNAQVQKKDAAKSVKEKQDIILDQQRELAHLKSELSRFEDNNEEVRRVYDSLVFDVDQIAKEVSNLHNVIDLLKGLPERSPTRSVDSSFDTNRILSLSKDNVKGLRRGVKILEAALEDLKVLYREECDGLNLENKLVHQKLEQAKQSIARLEQQLADKDLQISSISAQLNELSDVNRENHELRVAADTTRKDVAAARSAASEALRERDAAEESLKDVEARLLERIDELGLGQALLQQKLDQEKRKNNQLNELFEESKAREIDLERQMLEMSDTSIQADSSHEQAIKRLSDALERKERELINTENLLEESRKDSDSLRALVNKEQKRAEELATKAKEDRDHYLSEKLANERLLADRQDLETQLFDAQARERAAAEQRQKEKQHQEKSLRDEKEKVRTLAQEREDMIRRIEEDDLLIRSLKEDVGRLGHDNKRLAGENNQLKNNSILAIDEVEDLKIRNGDLKRKLNESEAKVNKLSTALHEAQVQHEEDRRNAEKVAMEREEAIHASHETAANEQLRIMDRDLAAQKKLLKEANDRSKSLEDELNHLSNLAQEQEVLIKQVQTEKDRTLNDYKRADAELKQNRSQIEASALTIEQLRQDVSNLEDRSRKLENANAKLKTQLNSADIRNEENDMLLKEAEADRVRIRSLQDELADQDRKIADLKRGIKLQEDKNAELNSILEENVIHDQQREERIKTLEHARSQETGAAAVHQREIERLIGENKLLIDDNHRLEQDAATIDDTLRKVRHEADQLRDQNEELRKEIEFLDADSLNLEETVRVLREENEKLKRLENDISNASIRDRELSDQLDETLTELREAKRKIDDLSKKNTSLQQAMIDENRDRENAISNLEKRLNNLTQENNNLQVALENEKRTEKPSLTMVTELQDKKRELADIKQGILRDKELLMQQADVFATDLQKMKNSLRETKNELKSVSDINDKYSRYHEEAEIMKSEFTAQFEKNRDTITHLRGEIDSIKKVIDRRGTIEEVAVIIRNATADEFADTSMRRSIRSVARSTVIPQGFTSALNNAIESGSKYDSDLLDDYLRSNGEEHRRNLMDDDNISTISSSGRKGGKPRRTGNRSSLTSIKSDVP